MWDKVKNLIGTAAPVVGTLIGGPAGTAVGTLISGALGVENTPEAIEKELRQNPDALLKIKQLESDERIEALKMVYVDRAGAREMNIKVQTSSDWLVRNTGSMIAIFTVLSAFVMDVYLLYLSANNQEINSIFTLIAGAVSARAVQVLSFYFGDSKASADSQRADNA